MSNANNKDSITNIIKQSQDNNKEQILLESFNNIDLSDIDQEPVASRAVELLKGLLNRVVAKASLSEANFTSQIAQLTERNSYFERRFVEVNNQNIEYKKLVRQLRQEKAQLQNNYSLLEQDRVIIKAQLAEYRETLQELAGHEFFRFIE